MFFENDTSLSLVKMALISYGYIQAKNKFQKLKINVLAYYL